MICGKYDELEMRVSQELSEYGEEEGFGGSDAEWGASSLLLIYLGCPLWRYVSFVCRLFHQHTDFSACVLLPIS